MHLKLASMHACMHAMHQADRQVHACRVRRVVTCIRQWGKKMVDAGFQALVFEDAMEVQQPLFHSSQSLLVSCFRHHHVSSTACLTSPGVSAVSMLLIVMCK